MPRFTLLVLALELVVSQARVIAPLATPRALALNLRGGFMDVDPVAAAKVSTTIISANGVLMSQAPQKAGEIYGIDMGPMEEWIGEGIGHVFVGTALMAWLALNGASTNTAIGCGLVPQLVQSTKTLLNGTPTALGVPQQGMIFNLALNAFAVYALLTGQEFADSVTKFMIGFAGLNGVAFAIAPAAGAGAWGVKGDEKVEFFMKALGFFLTGWAVMGGALVKGEEATKAIGLSLIPAMGHITDVLFISKWADKFGMAKNPQYFNGAVMVAVILATLL